LAIPLNTFFTVTPSSNFKSKAHVILLTEELFFYVSDTNELRVQNFGGSVSFTLAVDTKWCAAIQAVALAHVYYADQSGQMFYIPYSHFGATVTPQVVSIGQVITFSALFAPQSTPPTYMIMTDDGINHNLFVATDPAFHSVISSSRTYSNLVDPKVYVTRPTIAMHPSDTNRITVHCQQFTVLTSVPRVGFYVVKVRGLA
jgi:hypothetical protein